MLTDAKFEELRATYGDVRRVDFLDDDDNVVTVVLRKPVADMHDPKRDEFLGYQTKKFLLEQSKGAVADPTQDGSAELVACVVHPDQMAVRAHLRDYPGNLIALNAAFLELAGEDAVQQDNSHVTEEMKSNFHRRACGFKAGGRTLVARPMTQAEYQRFVAKNGGRPYPFRAEALAWVAWSCVQELPKVDEAEKTQQKRKPDFESLLGEFPILASVVGIHLANLSVSRTVNREKK